MLTDFNDMLNEQGIEAVKGKIDGAKPVQEEAVTADAIRLPDREFHNTDEGHAKRLRVHVEGWCHFVEEWKKYVFHDGKVWKVDSSGVRALVAAAAISRQLLAEAAATDDKVRRKLLRDESEATESIRSRTNAIAMLKSLPGIAVHAEVFDANPNLLNFQNGTLDIKGGGFRGHDPRDLLTCILAYSYDPDAQCPIWLRVVAEIWPDPATAAFIQRWAGYCMTGSTKEQVLLFLFGHGANGKTLFAKVLQLLLGEYACQCTMSLLIETKQKEHTTELTDLRGKYLAVCAETPAGMYWNEVLVKNATGGDRMKARRMYEDNQEWDATHKFLILGNNKPRVRGQDLATWRRMILVHCDQTFPEGKRDPDLLEKLTRELAGIANWALEGTRMWLRDGLRPPAKVKESTEEYRSENDILGPFILECCVVSPEAVVTRSNLFAAYAAWAKKQGEEHVMSTRTFADLVRAKGFEECKPRVGRRRERAWAGIGLSATSVPGPTFDRNSGNFSATQPHEEDFPENAAPCVPGPTCRAADDDEDGESWS